MTRLASPFAEPSEVPPSRLKRGLLVSCAAGVGSLVALWLLFGVLIEAPSPDGCITGLYEGTYGDLLVPVHLLAFGVMAAATGWLARQRSPQQNVDRGTVLGIGLCCVFVIVAYAVEGVAVVAGLIALVGIWLVAPALVLGAVVHTVSTRRAGLPVGERWRRHAQLGQVGLWLGLSFGLMFTFATKYSNGAGFFCF